MTAALHHLGSELINKYQQVAGKDVFNAIEDASRSTGVDFGYLLEQAQAESNFDADVKAKTSSATGLYQFIERTWLETVAKHGYKHGLGKYGQEITFDPKRGKISVSSPKMKQEILELRKNPEIASKMAAEFAKDNRDYLAGATKKDIGSTEMYLAHFLGAGSAAKFINGMDRNGNQPASKLFPAAARANKSVFYNHNGTSKSLDQVYAFFDKKFSNTPIAPSDKPAGEKTVMPQMMHFAAMQAQPEPAEMVNVMTMDLASSAFTSTTPSTSYSFATNTWGGHEKMNEMDVMMLSHMIRQLSHIDNSRGYDAYQTSGRWA